ncbi:UNVERIFIED_CONTAM: hypothetical protein PYX00_007748 [Menopon gallinae]|uniref:Mitochondrial intermembrane space import and assembly protein 40 n=1 Tax=Menopon gallinae TaxID=328185 RepID=A0AAW2HKF7_9NEOP
MTSHRQEGKDLIIFATAENHRQPSKVVLPEEDPQPGLILPNGEINWNCPCLGGMATGPCGLEFREAFSCYHNSQADPKGSDCYDAFKEMHLCMAEYPSLYMKDEDEKDIGIELDDEVLENVELQTQKDKVEKVDNEKKVISKVPSSEPAVSNKKLPA